MRRANGFTLIELSVAIGIGMVVTAGSMTALRAVVRVGHDSKLGDRAEWTHAANRLLIADMDQASAITIDREELVIDTVVSSDVFTGPSHEPSRVRYFASDAHEGRWWVREASPQASRTNAAPRSMPLGPHLELIQLEIREADGTMYAIDLDRLGERRAMRLEDGPFLARFRISDDQESKP